MLPLPTPDQLKDNPQALQQVIDKFVRSRHRVKITFFNRLSTQRTVPLSPSLLQEITFDRLFTRPAKDYSEAKGVAEEFPFIESGEHILEIRFKNAGHAVLIPVVVPEEAKESSLLVFLSFESNNEIKNVLVGYDTNGDNQPDTDQPHYRSQDGRTYFIHNPDGTVVPWKSKFLNSDDTEKPVPETDQPLPPGTQPQPGGKTVEGIPTAERKPPPIKVEIPKRIPPATPPDAPRPPASPPL